MRLLFQPLIRRSNVELKAQNLQQAEADARHALQLLSAQSESGMHSSNMGRAYLALAISLRDQGRWSEARDAFQSAFQNLQDTLGPLHPDSKAAHDTNGTMLSGS